MLLFLLAGLCEIGGGYMLWRAVKSQAPTSIGLFGAMGLVLYGVIATFQPAGFGRTYAAYGGIFVVMALLWSWLIDNTEPDRFDILGGLIVLAGAAIIFYAPRK